MCLRVLRDVKPGLRWSRATASKKAMVRAILRSKELWLKHISGEFVTCKTACVGRLRRFYAPRELCHSCFTNCHFASQTVILASQTVIFASLQRSFASFASTIVCIICVNNRDLSHQRSFASTIVRNSHQRSFASTIVCINDRSFALTIALSLAVARDRRRRK